MTDHEEVDQRVRQLLRARLADDVDRRVDLRLAALEEERDRARVVVAPPVIRAGLKPCTTQIYLQF